VSRRGFALLAVLWVLAALTALAGASLAVARTGGQTTRNRILLARAEWAREACVEILRARYARNEAVRRLDTVSLGRGTWCRATVDDPATKLNLNLAEPDQIRLLVAAVSRRPSLADSLLAIRRRGPIADLAQVPGIDSALLARLAPFLTTRGTGVIDVNAASREVLTVVPGMTEEAIGRVLGRRGLGSPLQGTDELAGPLSRSARAALYAQYPEFLRTATFAPTQLVATVEGGVRGTPLVARVTLTLVPLPGRLAVIRREAE
jgi:DNA uptake protein ComE-like DNA-binding protein